MSVILRPYRRGGWEVDIRLVLPDNSEHRERRKAPVTTRTAAQRWGEAREREWYQELTHPQPKADAPKEVPTLEQFAPRFLDSYARANRQKPSGVAAKEMIIRVHLVRSLGSKALNAIAHEDVQGLKRQLLHKAPKTVARMERHRFRRTSIVRSTIGVEGANRVTEKRSASIRAAHHTARGDTSGSPSPSRTVGLVSRRRIASDRRFGSGVRASGGAEGGRLQQRTAHATRSVRIWRCAARRHERFRNWPDIRI